MNNVKFLLSMIIATFFGAGKSPKAPGTVGSFFAVLFYLWLKTVLTQNQLVLSTVFLFLIGWLCCSYIVKITKNKDPQIIVIDEVVGIFVVMNMLPFTYLTSPYDLYFAVLCFVLFRFFDITKPFPVSWADTKVKGGLGVMLDDVLAGFYAGFVIWIGLGIYKTF